MKDTEQQADDIRRKPANNYKWASTAGKMQMIAGGAEAVSTAGQVTRYKHGSRL